MFVRVNDKKNNRYYKSIVYAIISTGWFEKYIVINPYLNTFELVEHLDKSERPAKAMVEVIQNNCDGFIQKKQEKVELLFGFPDVCENSAFIKEIINNKIISVGKYPIQIRKLVDEGEWKYIHTQKDVNDFMQLFVGFHDATLDKLLYEEEHGHTKATLKFDNSDWYGVVDLCFEGIIDIHIRPAGENYDRYIMDATLLVNDEAVFWADSYMEREDLLYDGSYVKALNLKWRKVD